MTREFELVIRELELLTCRFELVTREFELVTGVVLFHVHIVFQQIFGAQWPEIEYPDIYDYLINTPGKYERATLFLVSLFGFLSFLFLKRFIEELQIIVAKKQIVEFCQIIGF